MQIRETLAYIDWPGKFWAGIVLWGHSDDHDSDVVIEAADIVRYMKKQKWTRARVRDYCAKRGWTVKVIHELMREDT